MDTPNIQRALGHINQNATAPGDVGGTKLAVQIFSSDLSMPLKVVAIRMALYLDWRRGGGSAYPSLETLARECGCSKRSAWGHVQALVQKGILVPQAPATGGRGRTVPYVFNQRALIQRERPEAAVASGSCSNHEAEQGAGQGGKRGKDCNVYNRQRGKRRRETSQTAPGNVAGFATDLKRDPKKDHSESVSSSQDVSLHQPPPASSGGTGGVAAPRNLRNRLEVIAGKPPQQAGAKRPCPAWATPAVWDQLEGPLDYEFYREYRSAGGVEHADREMRKKLTQRTAWGSREQSRRTARRASLRGCNDAPVAP
jgi:biotin operon repressor